MPPSPLRGIARFSGESLQQCLMTPALAEPLFTSCGARPAATLCYARSLSPPAEPLPLSSMSTEHESPAAAYARLLSLAVHELRTPASVVGGYLRMLQRDTDSALTDRQRKMVDEAEKSCARMVALIAEMSEVSKSDAGVWT